MACWSVRITAVALRAENLGLLAEALRANGFHRVSLLGNDRLAAQCPITGARLLFEAGELTVEGNVDAAEVSARVARHYAKQAIETVARKRGWHLTEQPQTGALRARRTR